ncbi:MAG: hypothetical protein NTZ13_00890 [Candidatus Parcubacteria bacterium]|nr:hypothetical protein [Candidatus Parcubacteria bacterium]
METFGKKMNFDTSLEMMRIPQIVFELRKPTERILEKLSPELESGGIQLIIGDDASGRIPTAIFRKIFDTAYKERGFTTPETRFLAGSKRILPQEKEAKKEKISEYLEQVKKDVEKKFGRPLTKALVVTDVVVTGHSLDPLFEALYEAGIEAKVASMTATNGETYVKEIEKRWHAPVYFGGDYMPDVYGNQKISGVVKDGQDLFAETYKNKWRMIGTEEGEESQSMVNKARELSNQLAVDAYEKWKTLRKKEI